jgi:hypothetical protein
VKYDDTKISIPSAPTPLMMSRDDESSLDDDEYDSVKNANDTDIQSPNPEDISFSTLGSPIDATPITPRPIPNEIEFLSPSCLRQSKYTSTDTSTLFKTTEPKLTDRQILTTTYISNSFNPTQLTAITDIPPYDIFTNTDTFLNQQGYSDLVGIPIRRTPVELRKVEEDRFADILHAYTDADDPILSTKIDLRRILFTNQQYHLTEEEESMPQQLLHQEDQTIQAFAMKSWHRVLHKDLDAQKLRPFLAFRPIDIVRKTLANTTQMARLIIRYPFRKHVKARFPFLNTRRINEGISTDRLYSNCADAGFGYTSAHVFYGMKTTNIQVYGHRPGGDGFFNCYRDFCRNHGVPSVLRRDNAQELKSNKVLDFNREHLIRDEFSEVENQQQNVVESGGIRWLKSAIHVLLDMTGAPAWTWFLAATYLADVHNHTWNNEREMIPTTARDGITRDISRLLQFVFWEKVLYLDHVDSFPQSKERPGYFVGCSPNVGDDLTFRIYDDQSKQVVNVSVVRPYTSNKRVKWDAKTISTSTRPKLTQPTETWHPTPPDDEIMDEHDYDEPDIIDKTVPPPIIDATTDPDQFFEPAPERIKKYDSILEVPDICLIPPSIDKMLELHLAQDDAYKGDSLLRFSPLPIKMHPDLKKPSRTKRIPSSTTEYEQELHPPFTDEVTRIKELLKTTLIGQRIAKRFDDGIYIGTVTGTWTADDHHQQWTIRYDDEDGEDLDLAAIREAISLYKIYPHEYRYPGIPPTTKNGNVLVDRGAATPDLQAKRGVNDHTTPSDLQAKRGDEVPTTPPEIPSDRGDDSSSEKDSADILFDEENNITRRRSTRLKNQRKSYQSKTIPEKCITTLARLGIIMFTSSAIVHPTTTSIQPPISPSEIAQTFPTVPIQHVSLPQLEPTDTVEELRAYHSYLDKLNDMFSPDPHNQHWTPESILSHHVQHLHDEERRKVYLKVQWPDDDSPNQVLKLDDLRMDEPWLCVRYAFQNDLVYKPGWEWIPKYLEEDKTLATMIHTYRTSALNGKKYEFGVEIPKTPKAAKLLDQANGDELWKESILKELYQVIHEFNSFKVLEDGEITPFGYKKVPYHVIFACKVDGRRKARLVIDGNRSPPVHKEDCFAPVVSIEAIRLGFLLAQMHDLKCVAGDVGNAFLTSFTTEKLYIIAGPEFGPEFEGKRLLLEKSVYGTRTGAARFHESLSAKLRRIHFRPSRADPDLWLRKTAEGGYEYIARYVDDVMCFSKNPEKIIHYLEEFYTMKGVGYPQFYLGGDVVEFPPSWKDHGVTFGLSSHTYIKNCVENLERMCDTNFRKVSVPHDPNYHPELDNSELCSAKEQSKYRSLLGSANWMVTLGRFDIHYAVNTLAQYTVAPRQGHFLALQRIFGYLKQHPRAMLTIDSSDPPGRNIATFHRDCDWSEFFPDAIEDLPTKSPDPYGAPVKLTVYVDADHARNNVTRRSVTGILLLINNTPLVWISKRQRTVETSTFGSEMIAARMAIDLIIEMRYKLRCLGIRVEKRSELLGDNLSVVVNTTLPSSKIKKKHLSCQIMRVREAIAAGFVRFGHVRSEQNIADIMTKPLGPHVFHRLAHPYLFRHLGTHKDDKPEDTLNAPIAYRHYTQPTAKKSLPHSKTNPNLLPS